MADHYGTARCTCRANPVVTRQQCPRCCNTPSGTVHWPPQPGYPSQPGRFPPGPNRPIGFPVPNARPFRPPGRPLKPPGRPLEPHFRPVFHVPPVRHTPPPPPSVNQSCPYCSKSSRGCGCCQSGKYPVVPPPPPNRVGFKSYYWVDTHSRGGVPSTAIRGGYDVDGAQIFVGRAFHEGDWIPAKVIPDRNVAYVAYGGGEHAKDQYQVLCEQRFDWVPSSGGQVPPGAVEGGRTSDGESLYIGRVHHNGAVTVGKIHPSHGVCYIPFDCKEEGHQHYETLVLRS